MFKILEKRKKKKWEKFFEEERDLVKKKKEELKQTVLHGRHLGQLPFRDVRVECFSLLKRCSQKKKRDKKEQRGEVRKF